MLAGDAVIDAVLLIAFGGPTAPHEIQPFLEIVTRGRRIPPERLCAVAQHYHRMPGERSPLNELTSSQARGLERTLAERGTLCPVHVGMRNWHPFLAETLADMATNGVRRALGIVLSAFRTETSWDRYMSDVAAARARVADAPEVVFAPPWSDRPGFIEAVAARAREKLEDVPEERRAAAPVVFTAHSVPVAMADASPYVSELESAARAVAERLDRSRWSIAYQSRSGNPHEPWLSPDVNEELKGLASIGDTDVLVVPIGFVVDHVEVLYDLDVEARAVAARCGLAVHRAGAVNDHPAFIDMLADLVMESRE